VDKILRGANPVDMPIAQPIEFDMVINLKTAKALGITIPQSLLLLRADEVMQGTANHGE
jgi:putative tryptophan/tyrosine transport system substrate-binding protein